MPSSSVALLGIAATGSVTVYGAQIPGLGTIRPATIDLARDEDPTVVQLELAAYFDPDPGR